MGLAIALIAGGATFGAAVILKSLGFESVFTNIKISDAMKVFISLYLTGASMSLGLSGLALFMILKGRTTQAGWLGIFASLSAIATLLTGPSFAVGIEPLATIVILAGAIMSLLGAIRELKTPSPPLKGPSLSTLEIANSAVLSRPNSDSHRDSLRTVANWRVHTYRGHDHIHRFTSIRLESRCHNWRHRVGGSGPMGGISKMVRLDHTSYRSDANIAEDIAEV